MPTRRLGGARGALRRLAVETRQGKGWHEPYESRDSRTDLWETGGAIPPVDPAPESMSRVKITVSEQRPARAVAGDINRRLLPGFLQEWQEVETRRLARYAEMELYQHQVELLHKFVPEFHQLSNRSLTGADEFHFQDGSVQLYSSYKASLRLSLPFPDLVRVLMELYGNTPAEA